MLSQTIKEDAEDLKCFKRNRQDTGKENAHPWQHESRIAKVRLSKMYSRLWLKYQEPHT